MKTRMTVLDALETRVGGARLLFDTYSSFIHMQADQFEMDIEEICQYLGVASNARGVQVTFFFEDGPHSVVEILCGPGDDYCQPCDAEDFLTPVMQKEFARFVKYIEQTAHLVNQFHLLKELYRWEAN